MRRKREKTNVKGLAMEINWGGGGGLEGWHKRSRVRAHIRFAYLHTCEPTVPGMQRWITMETDCEPMGKQSNYDVLGKQSEC